MPDISTNLAIIIILTLAAFFIGSKSPNPVLRVLCLGYLAASGIALITAGLVAEEKTAALIAEDGAVVPPLYLGGGIILLAIIGWIKGR